MSSWRNKSFGSWVHHSGSEWDDVRCFDYKRVSRLWSRHSHQPHLGGRPISLGFGTSIKLTNAVVERSSRVTHNKVSRKNLEWSHVRNGWWWEECGTQWYDKLTFICFYRCLSLWAKPDTSVSNITQRPRSPLSSCSSWLWILTTTHATFTTSYDFNLSTLNASLHQHMETLLMELHLTCGSNSLRQSPILIQLIHIRQEESF